MWSFLRRAPRLDEIAQEWFAERERTLKPNWVKESRRFMERDILPQIGTLRVGRVTRRDVSRALERIAQRGSPRIADLALAQTRALYRWAITSGRFDGPDPTSGLRKLGTGQPRERVLSDDEIRAVWCIRASPEVRDALRLQLLLGLRISEAMEARRCEVDLVQRVWTLPPARTKSRRAHRLPLSTLAVAVLQEALGRHPRSEWLFPACACGASPPPSAGPVRAKSAQRATLRLGMGFSSHDLRRTCATRLGELGTSDDVIARLLNHAPVGITRHSYNHSLRLSEMRVALEVWSRVVQEVVAPSAAPCVAESPQIIAGAGR